MQYFVGMETKDFKHFAVKLVILTRALVGIDFFLQSASSGHWEYFMF